MSYDDLERQHIVMDIVSSNDQTFPFVQESIESFDPAGGLDRREVAELVAYEAAIAITVGSNADSSVVLSNLELSLDAEMPGRTENAPAGSPFYESQTDFSDAIGGGATGEINWAEYISPDVLARASAYIEGPVTDTTGYAGGGSAPVVFDVERSYREYTDQGPTLDRHNDMHVHWAVDQAGATDGSVQILWDMELIWNVFEE